MTQQQYIVSIMIALFDSILIMSLDQNQQWYLVATDDHEVTHKLPTRVVYFLGIKCTKHITEMRYYMVKDCWCLGEKIKW